MSPANDLLITGPVGQLSVRTKGLDTRPDSVVVMVQGSNLAGQTGYDFSFAGGHDYSLMDALVQAPTPRRIGTVTFSLRGYGQSAPPEDPLACGTDSAVEDLEAVMDWLAGQGVPRAALLGWSWGGRIIGHYAARHPDRVAKLVLLGPAIGGGDPILPAPTEPWWYNTREEYRRRLDPTYMDSVALEALIEHIATHDPRAPNAIRVENAIGSVPIDPTAITCPTLLVYGSEGGHQAYMKGVMPRAAFFEALATRDKLLAVVPDASDYVIYQKPRRLMHGLVANFLGRVEAHAND